MVDKIENIVEGERPDKEIDLSDDGSIDLSDVKKVRGDVGIEIGDEENSRKAHRYSTGKGCLLVTGGFVGGVVGASYGVSKLIEYFC